MKIQSLDYHVKWILETNLNIYFRLRVFHLKLSANSTCKEQKDIYINYTSNMKKFEGKKTLSFKWSIKISVRDPSV